MGVVERSAVGDSSTAEVGSLMGRLFDDVTGSPDRGNPPAEDREVEEGEGDSSTADAGSLISPRQIGGG